LRPADADVEVEGEFGGGVDTGRGAEAGLAAAAGGASPLMATNMHALESDLAQVR
jgi:hypothetical protein